MDTPKQQTSRVSLLVYSTVVALTGILLFMGMLASPSEPESAVLFGLSRPRLVLAFGLLILSSFFVFTGIRSLNDRAWAEGASEQWFGRNRVGRWVGWLAAAALLLGWLGCFLPAYRAGPLALHWERLRPVMMFLLAAGLATLVMIFVRRSRFAFLDPKLSAVYRAGALWFFPSLALIGLMLYSGFGVYAPEDYWYGAGVPILITQLIVAIGAGVLFLRTEKSWASRRFDWIVFLLIYILAAALWAREPLQRSFLFIGPYPPNRVLYPFADAALFDTASQFALIGQNFLFYNGPFFERALYASFLVFLHSLVGQDYGQVMAAQAAIFAVFPALVYLIGRSLNSRAVGFATALVATFRGANSIAASNMIDMANPKMMLTDFPTAIGVALIILLTCEWMKGPQQKWHYVIWIGGIVGLSIMLRTNALVFLVLIPLYSILRFFPDWKRWLASSFLFILAVFATTLPWEWRNQSLGGQIYGSLVTKFRSVIELRYTPPEPEGFAPQEDMLAWISFKQAQVLLDLYPEEDALQEYICHTTACFVPSHFLHNILTSILVLPTSFVMDDLRHTVRESFPYWRPDWQGAFAPGSLLFFALNLFFIVLGIAIAWRQQRFIGLAPLAVFLVYNLSNGFARTSGGRYIVPVDWILIVYFLMGVFQTLAVLARGLGSRWSLFEEEAEPDVPRRRLTRQDLVRGLAVLTLLFGAGALVPLAENLHASRYDGFDLSAALAERETDIARAGLSLQQISSFLQHPNAEISVGRALYPRYYLENQGEVHFYPVVVMGFPRTTFTLVGPGGEKGIVLPGEKPDYFPHAVDALVIGCRESQYMDALAVIVLDEKGAVYTRSPESPLQCPLKQPVCDNNHNCY